MLASWLRFSELIQPSFVPCLHIKGVSIQGLFENGPWNANFGTSGPRSALDEMSGSRSTSSEPCTQGAILASVSEITVPWFT